MSLPPSAFILLEETVRGRPANSEIHDTDNGCVHRLHGTLRWLGEDGNVPTLFILWVSKHLCKFAGSIRTHMHILFIRLLKPNWVREPYTRFRWDLYHDSVCIHIKLSEKPLMGRQTRSRTVDKPEVQFPQ